jgi:hypothetical protein
MKEALKNKFNIPMREGIAMWIILWFGTLIIYLMGKNPVEVPIIIVADIVMPFVVFLLLLKYKKLEECEK